MVGAAGWEWARLGGLGQGGSLALGAVVVLACLGAWQAGWALAVPSGVWWASLACWVVAGAWALKLGPSGWSTLPVGVRLVAGVLALTAAWLALVAAKQHGLGFILSSLCIVWAADIGAYFGGRNFGKRKLAPTISPGKSWEGVWSGMIAVVLLAWGWLALESAWPVAGPSVFATLMAREGLAWLLVCIVALCGLSVVGDLMESLAKRAVGAKDSSRLLPGHGGVLDRIDALLPVLPAVMALTSV
jgi:phosphatidate cytidylyltransferase